MRVKEGDLVKHTKSIKEVWNLPYHEDILGIVIDTFEDGDGIPYAKIAWSQAHSEPPMWYPADGLKIIRDEP